MAQRSSKWVATPAARISADEMAYHVKVVHDREAARESLRLIEAVAGVWAEHLKQRYGLADDDSVNADGTIVRQPAPDAPAAIDAPAE